jgi:hypothetical protein
VQTYQTSKKAKEHERWLNWEKEEMQKDQEVV